MTETLQRYWNAHIHDASVARHPVGTKGFFNDLDEYRFDKQAYLLQTIDFAGYKGKKLLEVGCGIGIDLVRFARGGALVTGIDLSEGAVELAVKNFELSGVDGNLTVMDAERLQFSSATFDVVYAHGLLPYAANVQNVLDEIYRVLRPHGSAILQAYNRQSWLYLMSKLAKVKLEHEDAPVFHTHTMAEFRMLLRSFSNVRIIVERFPVKTRLHRGLKARIYNSLFVDAFNAIPKRLRQRFGWHLLAIATK